MFTWKSRLLFMLAVAVLVSSVLLAFQEAPAKAQGTRHRVEGVLSTSNGEPLAGQRVVLVGAADSQGQGGVDVSAPDGNFAVEVPDGAYHVRTVTGLGNHCTVSGYDNPDSGWQAIIEVRGEHVTGILVTVAGEPSAAPALLRCAFALEELGQIRGTVTDAQGQPVPGVRVAATRYGDAGGAPPLVDGYDSDWTEAGGAFHLRLQPGAYLLHVQSASSQACSVSGQGNSAARGRAVFDTADGDVDGLRIVVSGTASASPVWSACSFASSVTNELRPGWNLAGWLGAETGIESLFEQIPGLALVYAWNTDEQRFVPALPPGGGLAGELELLTPGLGLWLYLGGTESVAWTRDAVDEGLLRKRVLRPGWNLVTWMGLDEIPLAAAVGDLGSSFVTAAAWDRETQRFVSPADGEPESADSPIVRRGEVFWVHSSGWRQWWQHGDSRDLVFLGDVPAARQTQIRELIADTETYFETEFGLVAPHLTTYIAASQADLATSFLDATGAPVSATACAARGRNFILLYCQGDLTSIFPQEYFHVLQSDLTASFESADLTGAGWLLDGTAAHAAALYRDARAIESYDAYLASVVDVARTQRLPLTDSGATASSRLAVDLLIQRGGDESFVEVWRQVGSAVDWRDAFQQVFGLPLEEFLELFEAHRAEFAPNSR